MGCCCSVSAEDVEPETRLDGKVALITGATGGIGLYTAKILASKGCHVVLLGRSKKKLSDTVETIRKYCGKEVPLNTIECDLTSLSNCYQAVQSFLSLKLPLHYLINNAGVMAQPFNRTKDGFDVQMATNHLSHFLITDLLLETLKKTSLDNGGKGVKIINISSTAHSYASMSAANISEAFVIPESKYDPWTAYGNSKLANILHAGCLANMLKDSGIITFSVHPGVVRTDLGQHGCSRFFWCCCAPCMKSVSQGTSTTISAILDQKLEKNSGSYLADNAVAYTSSLARDNRLALALWEESAKLIQPFKNGQTENNMN